MKFEKLFERGKIGKLELKNRIVMPPMFTGLAETNGDVSDRNINYFEARAKGGCGLIIVGITRIDDETGWTESNQLGATKHHHIAGLARLANAVHKHGTGIIVQLQHPGWRAYSRVIGQQPVGVCDGYDPRGDELARGLTRTEVYGMIEKFIKGAEICHAAGMDGVEIHAAHGYLIHEFLSPAMNKRTDEFGGSYENRFRFLKEVVTGIRTRLPKDFVLSVRLSVDEYIEGGLNIEKSIQIAKDLEALGVDSINVSNGGGAGSSPKVVEVYSYPQGWKRELATAIKANVNIPVIAVNVLRTPDVAEQMLQEDVCDFVAVGRSQIADPNWGNKAYEGREDEIRSCIGCMYCYKCIGIGKNLVCAINPAAGREAEYAKVEVNGQGKTVAVIGGGPAGMEAALVLKERGFEPVLFEKGNKLGGSLIAASMPPHKYLINRLWQTMARQVEIAGIDVRLNTAADIEKIKELNPVGVIIAAGGNPIKPPITGIDSKNVYFAEEILVGKTKVEGKRVHVIGSGLTGLETAMWLTENGHEAKVFEMLPRIGLSVYPTILQDLTEKFVDRGITTHANSKLVEVTQTGAVYENVVTGERVTEECDAVVLAVGVAPDKAFVEEFRAAFENVHVVGDSLKGGSAAEAINTGHGIAFTFEPLKRA